MPILFYFSSRLQNAALRKRFCLNKSVLLFLLVSFFGFTTAIAQTFPSPSSCTSKDLLLVKASVPNTPCETCDSTDPNSSVTKALTLAINNKTGSVRTAFSFWATLKILNADGSTYSTSSIKGCFGPIPKNATTSFLYGNITYPCGKTLQLINIWEAWTTSNANENCDFLKANTSTINPKCGIEPLLIIIAGVDANFDVTDATCTSLGSIKVTPYGGTGPYTVQKGTEIPVSVPIGGYKTFDVGPGEYTFTLKDANNCLVGVSRSRIVAQINNLTAPAISTLQPLCSTSTGTIAVTSPIGAGYTYSNGGSYQTSPIFTISASISGTYNITYKNGTGCISPSATTTITSPPVLTTSKEEGFILCNGGTTTVSVSATGGTAPYSGTGSKIVGAGPYSFTVTDSNGCTSTTTGTVIEPSALAASSSAGTISCNGGTTTVSVSATGGTAPYSGTGSKTVSTGPYSFTVTDSKGCTSTTTGNITEPAVLAAPTLCVVQPSLCSTSGSITVLSPTGTGYKYSIDNGVNWQIETLFPTLAAGSNPSIIVKSPLGCISNSTSSCNASNCTLTGKFINTETKTTSAIAPIETTITSKTTTVGFDAYPVPFKDQLTIKYKFDYKSDVKIEVFNAQGMSLLSKIDTDSYLDKELTLDLKASKRQDQVYVVKVTTNQGTFTKKVMSSK